MHPVHMESIWTYDLCYAYIKNEFYPQMYADMIFKFGYVHCDPHPGNVLVRKDRATGRPQIVLLDHGLYTVSSKSLSPQQFSAAP